MIARSPELPKATTCSLNVAVDARSKLDPPFPTDYLGIVVTGACLEVPLKNLMPSDEKQILNQAANIALQLRAAILRINNKAVREYISYIQKILNASNFSNHTTPENSSASML